MEDKLIISENVLRTVGWDFSGAESRNIKPRLGVSENGPWGRGQGIERAQHSSKVMTTYHTDSHGRATEEA